jgi:hypothetical protein
MASKAFTAVARAVYIVLDDDTDEDGARRLLGTPKNNLGRNDLPLQQFTVVGYSFDVGDERIDTARIEWGGQDTRSARDVLADELRDPDERSATADCADWLVGYLTSSGGRAESAALKAEASRLKFTTSTLQRARKRAGVKAFSHGAPRRTDWYDPDRWHKVGGALVEKVSPGSSRVTSPGERE